MSYEKIQDGEDRKNGICYIKGVCFAENETDAEIEEVFNDIYSMKVLKAGLRSANAVISYLCLPEYVAERLSAMKIGEDFQYQGKTVATNYILRSWNITRESDKTFSLERI